MEEKCVKCGEPKSINYSSYIIRGKPYCDDCGYALLARHKRIWKYTVKRMMRYLGKTRKECEILYIKYGYHTKKLNNN